MKAKMPFTRHRTAAKRQELLAIEAAGWVARGKLTDPVDREEFSQWLTESPAHVKELLAALAWSDTLDSDLAAWRADVNHLISESNVIQLSPETTPEPASPLHRFRLTRQKLMAVGAAAAAVTLAVIPLVQHILLGHVYSTDIGEQRTVALPDGSLVSMNTQSRARVTYSNDARNIHLYAGQAMFSVARDPDRPFRVYVDGTVVQAIGTKFDVRRGPTETKVAVIEGRVQISPRAEQSGADASTTPAARLTEGEGISILPSGEVTPPTPIDIKEAMAWQQRRLIFVDDTLNDIVAEFERYTRTRIHIQDAHIGQLRFSGVWDADRPDVLFTYLGKYGNISIELEGEAFVLRAVPDG